MSTSQPTATGTASQPVLPPILTQALCHAAEQAYSYYLYPSRPVVPPTGYVLAGCFTGYNRLGISENFGLVFTSISPARLGRLAQPAPTTPTDVIVAFRGTDSDSDDLEDLLYEFANFVPYDTSTALSTPFPATVNVHSGFYGLYAEQGWFEAASMREQIFPILQSITSLGTVYSTGHSLGGALSQLFALDLAATLPGTTGQTLNFASPQVGDSTWAAACDALGVTGTITRVVNIFDVVPYLPGLAVPAYVSVGQQFAAAFFALSTYDPLSEHSLNNLHRVLSHALALDPQVWVGIFEGYYKHLVLSIEPFNLDALAQARLAKIKELYELTVPARLQAAALLS